MSHLGGHDINYLAVAGALHPLVGPDRAPSPPLNMLGDFGGGGMLLAVGLLAGVLEARTTGVGRVVDAAIVDGVALQTTMLHSMRNTGGWPGRRGQNLFDGGSPFYRAYETSDGKWMAVGSVESKFYERLVRALGLGDQVPVADQYDVDRWPAVSAVFADTFKTRSQSEWVAHFGEVDACVTPVIAPWDVLGEYDGIGARSYEDRGHPEARPAPRFDGAAFPTPPPHRAVGSDTRRLLQEVGYGATDIDRLIDAGVAAQA